MILLSPKREEHTEDALLQFPGKGTTRLCEHLNRDLSYAVTQSASTGCCESAAKWTVNLP